ncbi:uncharacterized protein LOC113351911 [Papaver somniferum]|uniref:uncharacterized protein LOC113351911 n=1 Tax=Papaver somniferum TaxID=3469 RepID=UPI000E702C46|nr:uncharacterized protein LOC113351911 [Papaver somniferum]
MCGTEIETTEHLLLHCPYVKEVLNSSPNPISLNIDCSSTFLEKCKDWINNPRKKISLELMFTKMWFIWKEICNKIFENKSTSSNTLAIEIQGYIYFWSKRSSAQDKPKKQRKQTLTPVWKAPLKDTLKINVDDAWISHSLPSSYAIILRDDGGNSGGGKAGQSEALDPQEAEALGELQTAIWAQEKVLENFNIEGDYEILFNYVQGKKSDISWRSKAYLNEADILVDFCNNFLGFYFVLRLRNMVADTLAKYVRALNSTVLCENIPPSCIQH